MEDGEGSGSGVYVGDSEILTANHLYTEGATYYTDEKHKEALVIVKRDETKDLMLMRTTTKKRGVALGTNPARMDTTFTMGYVMGVANVILQGRVADFTDDQLLVDSRATRGMSGGGVFNTRGRLIGICTASWGDDHFMLATSVKAIKAFLKGG